MGKNRKNQTFELEKIIDFLESKTENKAIAISGKINNKKTKIINSIFQYMSQDEEKVSKHNTTFFNSILESNVKKNKSKYLEKETTYLVNKGVYNLNLESLIESINDSLKQNAVLENMWRNKFFKRWHRKIQKTRIKHIVKKISLLERYDALSASANKYKSIFPILTTITTIGTSIGTPILSIALLRHDKLLQILSPLGYNILIWFCGLAIISGIVSVIFYLISSIIANKYELITRNIVDGYKKVLSKYFLLPKQKKEDVKKHKQKISITRNSNYYFNEIDFNSENYLHFLNLIMIHNAIGNKVCFTVTINELYELKNLFNDSWGSSINYYVFNVNNYKNGYNKEKIINFLLSRISKDFDFIELYKTSDYFKNYLDAFYEATENNLQILNALNIFKSLTFLKTKKNYVIDNIYFFIDIFYLCLIKSLDLYTFDLVVDSIINDLVIPEDISKRYKLLKLNNFFTNNLKKHRDKSLFFNLKNINDDIFLNNIGKPNELDSKKIIDGFIEKNNFQLINKKNNIYINKFKDRLKVSKIKNIDEINNIFSEIDKVKQSALLDKCTYLIIDFVYEIIVMQNNLDNFHVIAWTSDDIENIKLM